MGVNGDENQCEGNSEAGRVELKGILGLKVQPVCGQGGGPRRGGVGN